MTSPIPSSRPAGKTARDSLIFIGLFNLYFAIHLFREPNLLTKLIPIVEYAWLAWLLHALPRHPIARKLVWPTALVFLWPTWLALVKAWVFGPVGP